MYKNQQVAQISVFKLYFPLDALHVSDYSSPSSGSTFYKVYIVFGIRQHVWLLSGYVYNHTTARRVVPAYTKCDVQLIKGCF